MMKHKGVYVLAITLLLAFTAGCGKNSETKNPQNEGTEITKQETTATPVPTATPEPTATPAPTATPKPANYMEEKGIEVLGAGRHGGKSFVVTGVDENGESILEVEDCEYIFSAAIEEDEGNGGTKIIQVTLQMVPYVNETGGWSSLFFSGFVDLKTGKAYSPLADELQTVVLEQGDESHIIQLLHETESPSVTSPYYTTRYTLVCPSDYGDAGFYVAGWDLSKDVFVERLDCWKLLQFIRHGESDMLVFGVDKGLATEPEKKIVDGTELAEENYFEAKGHSTKEEGTYTWLGMEALRRRNEETGWWESVSLEESEITTTVSITEEFLGDGTKQITWSKIETIELISDNEAMVPYEKCGIADKMTGLVYHPRTYSLAEPFVVEKDGEEFTILVGMELVEEELGDGKIKSCHTYTLVCPEDYEDAVLCLTADVEIDEDEHTYSNEPELRSLNEVEHGDYELMFFQ